MRLVVVTSLVSGLLLSSLPVAAAPHRLDSGAPDYPSAAWQEDDLAIPLSDAIDDAGADPDAGVPVDAAARPVEPPSSSSSSSSSGSIPRPERPVELPSNYGYQGSSTSSPEYYYEGDSCSGASGGYYEEDDSDSCSGDTYESSGGGDGVVIFTGDDDDDDDSTVVTGDDDDDDDDDDDTPIEWGDDDDDDDDDSTTTTSVKVTSASLGAKGVRAAPAPGRSSSPVSRLALLGALIVFPLRRRGRKPVDSA